MRRMLILRGAAAGLIAAGTALWACAPFFPNWLLGDKKVLAAPSAYFTNSLRGLEPTGAPPFPVAAVGDPYQQTSDTDIADVRKAVDASGALPAVREKILTAHAALRKALALDKPAPDLAVPRGLPPELADYLEGAIAYHQGHRAAAAAAWERLLARPAAERPLRSTWAAFMLGRNAMKKRADPGDPGDPADPDTAVRWFERTRELASQGFSDPLGLAFDSLGWQAKTEMDRGRYDRALPLYLEQSRGGAANSLPLACAEAMDAGPQALTRAAAAPRSRAILTAWVLTPSSVGGSHAKQWLLALKAAGIKHSDGADRIAWAAYQAGDFQSAAEWVARAPADSPMVRWIRAKLLLRRGDLEAARQLLHQNAALPALDMDEKKAWLYAWETSYHVQLATGPQAQGEEAVVLLAQGKREEALDGFLRSGYWLDAAWVAEREMTADELQAAVDRDWPAALAARFKPADWEGIAGGFIRPSPERLAYAIRYLLARRLLRDGRYAEARPYLPADLAPSLEILADGMRDGGDAARPGPQRAAGLFRAACVTRHQGMELLGTEADPDWFVLDKGAYELPEYSAGLAARHRTPPAAAGERERTDRHRATPWKRFHYRYRAAALARRAADLLPDGTDDKARILAAAGTWLAGKDPQAAVPFYRELIRSSRATRLGREAAERHWFPDVESCEGH